MKPVLNISVKSDFIIQCYHLTSVLLIFKLHIYTQEQGKTLLPNCVHLDDFGFFPYMNPGEFKK